MKKTFLLLLLYAACMVSGCTCNNIHRREVTAPPPPPPPTTDSTGDHQAPGPTATAGHDHDASHATDTPLLRSAVLGYSYFKEMKREETKFIHAFISVNHPESKVRDTLQTLNAQDGLETRHDTTSIFTRNMALYRFVDVSLVNAADSSFKITRIQDADRQAIDTVNGNHWEWAVSPITGEKTGVLILKVIAEKPDGSKETFQAQSIPIKIDVDTDILRRVWNYMTDNPGIVLSAILIPLIAWFGRRLFTQKKDAPPRVNR